MIVKKPIEDPHVHMLIWSKRIGMNVVNALPSLARKGSRLFMVWGTSARNLLMLPKYIEKERTHLPLENLSRSDFHQDSPNLHYRVFLGSWQATSSLSEVELSFQFLCNTVVI